MPHSPRCDFEDRIMAQPAELTRRESIAILIGALCFSAMSRVVRGDTAQGGPVMSYSILPVGQIQPRGWILQQMKDDLAEGIPGHIETYRWELNLHPFLHQNIQPGKATWGIGESEGYWLDGVTRLALCTGDAKRLAQVRTAYDDILARQAADPAGYIGCYNATIRYTPQAGGELWTKSRLFQGMLAFHEFTGEQKYLDAVKKAVALDMQVYSQKNYFDSPDADHGGGVAHAVGYFDTLDYLWRLTGDRAYLDFAVKFYNDFNQVYGGKAHLLSDLVVSNLANPDIKLADHTPHVCEGWYAPALVLSATGREDCRRAVEVGNGKLRYHMAPGGGVIGDEDIRGRPGAGELDHEYCGMTELISSLNRRLQYVGEFADADSAEKVALNDCQGARFHQSAQAVQYLSRDNRKEIPDEKPWRLQYRPVHNAACCALNVGRTMPYYIEGFWMRTVAEPGLAAMLYGPSVLRTKIGTTPVQIEQETVYPFADSVVFRITADQPSHFLLQLRVPGLADNVTVDCPAGITQQSIVGAVQLRGTWKSGDVVSLKFNFPVKTLASSDGKEKYYQRGPLVYAAKFEHLAVKTDQLHLPKGPLVDFWNYHIRRVGDAPEWDYHLDPDRSFQLVSLPNGDSLRPFAAPPIGLKGAMRDPTGKPVDVTLVPMGTTVLRRTSFPA